MKTSDFLTRLGNKIYPASDIILRNSSRLLHTFLQKVFLFSTIIISIKTLSKSSWRRIMGSAPSTSREKNDTCPFGNRSSKTLVRLPHGASLYQFFTVYAVVTDPSATPPFVAGYLSNRMVLFAISSSSPRTRRDVTEAVRMRAVFK